MANGSDATVKLDVVEGERSGVGLLEDVGDAALDAKKDVDRLGDSEGLEELARDAEESVKAFKKAERAFESAVDKFRTAKLSPAFAEGSKAAQRLRQEVVKTGRRLNDLAKGVPPELRKVGRGFQDVEKRVKAARAAIARFQKGARRIDGVVKSVTSLRTAVGALQVAFVAAIGQRFISALVRTSTEAVKLKASLDLIRPALKANLGSTDAAAEGYEFLERTSDRLKVTIDSLATNYVQLTAATKGTVIEGETTNRLFESITAAGRALGKSNEDISRAFLGLSQAAGGANVQMQEVRQITEAIPGLFAAWAKELGRTQGELRGLIATGKVTADQLATLADAAERLEGGALAEQLKTIAGQMQAFEVAAQATQVALAEGLEPGVKALLGTLLQSQDVIKAVAGELGGALAVELKEVSLGLQITDALLRQTFDALSKFDDLSGIDISELLGLEGFRDRLEGLPKAAKEAFDAIESGAISSAGAVKEGSDAVAVVAKSFGSLPEAARKAFGELATVAGIDAETRKKIAGDLADDVAEITERSVEVRARLEKRILVAIRAGGREEIIIREEVANAERRIADRAIEDTRKAIDERVRLAKLAAAAEKLAIQDRIKSFDELLKASTETERKRVEAQTAAAASMEALDEQLAAKRAKLQEEFLKAWETEEEKRPAAVKKVEDEIVKFAEEASRKRLALEQKLVEKARKASEERIALADREADAIIAANDRVRAAAEKDGGTGEDGEPTTGGDALAQTAAGVDGITASLEELGNRLEQLRFGGVPGSLDPAAILDTADAYNKAKLGIAEFAQVSTQAAQEAATAQEEIRARAEETVEAILAELNARKELSTAQVEGAALFTDALSGQIEALTTLAEQGVATDADIQKLAETWALYNGETKEETVSASQAVQEALAAQQEKLQEAAKATEDLTKAQESQVKIVKDAEGKITILQKTREKLTKGEEDAVQPTEEAAEAIKAEGEAADQAGEPVEILARATDELGEGAERAGAGLETVKDEATAVSEVEPPDRLVESFSNLAGIMPGLRNDIREVRDALQGVADLEPALRQIVDVIEGIASAAREAAAEASNLAAALSEVANSETSI